MTTEDAVEELRLMLARRDFVRVLHAPAADDLYAVIQAQRPKPPMQNRGARRRQAAQQRSRR